MTTQELLKENLQKLEEYNFIFDVSERKDLIAQMLKESRELFGLTQQQVADYIKIKAGTYSTYENGTREIPAELLVRLSILYDVPTDVLLQRDRFDKTTYFASKQVDSMKDDLEELSKMFNSKDSDINPDLQNLIQGLTDVFSNFADVIKKDNTKE